MSGWSSWSNGRFTYISPTRISPTRAPTVKALNWRIQHETQFLGLHSALRSGWTALLYRRALKLPVLTGNAGPASQYDVCRSDR
jgi:hypothetical protein